MTTVALAAALAQRPGVGGHTWFALQYLLGLRRLGCDVLLVDHLRAGTDGDIAYLDRVMRRFGLDGCWTVLLPDGDAAGLPRAEVERRLARTEVLLNVMGYLDDEALLGLPGRRVFVDIDPGFGQMWRVLGLADLLTGHDAFASVGLEVGREDCGVPDCGLTWTPTLPPVALDWWPVARGGTRITTVASWRGPFGPIDFGGRTYGLRVHEFRRFLELPQRTRASFELALSIDPADASDMERIRTHGWALADPRAVAGDPVAYSDYIRASRAELMVAKHMYVATGSGWFSDRSACYLASGKPVLAQATGWSRHLPAGLGLLEFVSMEDAVEAVEAILSEPGSHARAAREVAEEHLDARRVLSRLLEAVA